jgi:hypothetical protein
MLSLLCSKCRVTLQIDPKFAGQLVRCPKCSETLRAPSPAAPPGPPPRPAPAAPPPAAPKAAPELACDVFVSYRREDGDGIAQVVAEKLRKRGYRVFLDVENLGGGQWMKELEDRILQCPDFVPVVTPEYVKRLVVPTTVIHKEVATALSAGKQVVPLIVAKLTGDSPFPAKLPAAVSALPAMNGIKYVHEYAEEGIARLCTFLKSNPVRGPERLGAWDAPAIVVVGVVGLLLGTWQGSGVAEAKALHGGYAWAYALGVAFVGLFWAIVLGGLVVLGLSVAAHLLKWRRDVLFLGPWVPFWAVFVPVVVLSSSAVVGLLGLRSYFWGGVLGGWVGIGLMGVLALTNAWEYARTVLGFRRG